MPFKDPEYRNSAGRLMAMLDSISPRSSLLDGIQNLVDVKSDKQHDKQHAVIDLLSELHRMYVDFQQDMQEADIGDQERTILLTGLAGFKDYLYPVNIGQPIRALTDAERAVLHVCAGKIEQEGEITEDDLAEIRKSITELRSQVEVGDISPTLRKVLLELIRLAEDAISRYAIRGARGLRRAFKAMMGEAAELYVMADPEVKKSKVWSAMTKLLTTVDSVASKLLKYRHMIGAAAGFKALLGGGEDS